ncbi:MULTISPECIES: DUF5689 domain-containing protein [unclassified Spirosoma]|uniref:DUF5689 domain-containing protein n=1 Tax=unclassified Spirosoma TaxID=2621999 RepID=UPI000AA7E3B5|nr:MULTISPECIES: DUF5689 domain-containing protein [unclassified Spirosoma]MBN8824849.1 hypothetical protein [Spirosoma sp.]
MQRRILFVLTFLLVTYASWAQVSLTGTTSYTQNFNSLASSGSGTWTDNTTIQGWYAAITNSSNVTNAATTYTVDPGSSTTGGLHSYGATSATDRALGSVGSGSAKAIYYGVLLVNNTGSPITALSVSYKGEQWRSSTSVQNVLSFAYKVGANSVSESDYTSNSLLDFVGQPPVSSNGALDGNANAKSITSTFNVNIPVGEKIMLRWMDVDDSGNDAGLSVDDLTVSVVTSPFLVVNPTSVGNLVNTANNSSPSAPSTFTVIGGLLNPATPVSVSPPANFEISTDNASYSTSAVTISPSGNGTLSQTIYTRLVSNLSAGPYTGLATVSSTEVPTSQTASLSGTVYTAGASGACGTSYKISDVRNAADGVTFTITGRVTSSIGTNIYIQDATGGILLYTGTGTSIEVPELSIGDEVQVTGVLATYNGERELKNFTSCFVKTTSPNSIPTPVTVSATTLCDHKGELVTLTGVNTITPSGGTFTGNTNYTLTTGSGTVIMRVQLGTDLVAAAKPTGTLDVTGIVGVFNGTCQLLPRSTTDVPGATPNTVSCPGVGTGGAGISADNTLDITWWNVEWLGNTGFGPTNEAQQQDNVRQQLQNMNQDIYCLEEVTDLTKLDAIVATLNTNTGKSYTYTCGADPNRTPPIYYSHWFDSPEVPGNASTYAQKVCFVYNTAIVKNVTASQIVADASQLNSSSWASNRFPLLMSCDVMINGVTKNFKLVGVHAKSGSDASSYNRRIADFGSLKTYLDATYPTSNVMIMGDFNDDADQSIYIDGTTSTTNVSSFNNFIISGDYTAITKQLSTCNISSTASYPDIIDHLIISNEISTNGSFPASGIAYIPNSVTAVRPIVGGTTTSDHFPVSARFQFAPPLSATLVASTSAVCSGQPVNLAITVSGLGGATYSYTVTNGTNSTTTTGVSTSTTQISITPTVAGSFTLTVMSSANNSATAVSGNVAVEGPISVVAGPSSATTTIGGTVSLTATGATTYQWSAPAQAVLSPSTGSPVSATLTAAGVQTFTLLAGQGSCTQTTFVSVTATNGPDISPTIMLAQAQFTATDPDNVRNFVVNLYEVGYHSTTSGQLTITLSVPTGYTLTFDGTLTNTSVLNASNVITNVAVDNTNWDVINTKDGQQITLKIKEGQFMDANTQRNVGFSLTRTTANSGSVSSITVNVANDSGSGYDVNPVNNVYARIISGL